MKFIEWKQFKKVIEKYNHNNFEFFKDLNGNSISHLKKNARRLYSTLLFFNQYSKQSSRLCDFGTFPGTLFKLIKNFYPKFDLTATGIFETSEYVQMLENNNINFLTADFDPVFLEGYSQTKDSFLPLPAKTEPFDIIIASEILEHLLNPMYMLRTAFNWLKPGGTLIITTPNMAWIRYRLMLLKGLSPNPEIQSSVINPTGSGRWRPHLRLYTTKEIWEMLSAIGFQKDQEKFIDLRKQDDNTFLKDIVYAIPAFRHGILLSATKIIHVNSHLQDKPANQLESHS
ncbi:methyltransferase domain-containing protein [bacterium]|nr:methyltransferase domain-containing protein [bacterium]